MYIMLINVFNICTIENKTYINYGSKFISNVSKVLKLYVVILTIFPSENDINLKITFLLPCHIVE